MSEDRDEWRSVRAFADPELSARVLTRIPITYAAGADPAMDRPAHVRAASGVVWMGERLAVVQDDANFVALVDPLSGRAEVVPLPAGPGGARQFDKGRGNKKQKLDLEAVTVVPGRDGPLLIAFGSGSRPRRECVVVIARAGQSGASVELHEAPGLYAELRAATRFAGSQLNLEGAVYIDGEMRLFGRGNGSPRDGIVPVDATCDLDVDRLLAHIESPATARPPVAGNVVQYDLGTLGGVRLGFTDAACVMTDDDRLRRTIFCAAAEASPDAIRDGTVAGSAIGIIDETTRGIVARWAEMRDAAGHRLADKIEGIALSRVTPGRAFVVADRDAYDVASELCEVVLEGPGFADARGGP